MGRTAIVEKLDTFLQVQPLTTEAQATYLMVELRKVLDHAYDKDKDFSLLRFYSDWAVHTSKERRLSNMAPVIQAMYDHVKQEIENPHLVGFDKSPVVDFIYLEELKKEMVTLFKAESLPEIIFEHENWVSFVLLLVNVLIDQPIVNPIPEVSEFVFMEAAPDCIIGRMYFVSSLSNKDGTYSYYQFANAY